MKRQLSLLLTLVVGLALLLGACGDTATSQPTTAATTTVATTSAAATTTTNAVTTNATTTVATTTASTTSATTTTNPATTAADNTTAAAYSGPTTKFSLALDWTPNTNHTGIYVALAKGWYKQQGIDLQILPYSDSTTPETLVGTGKADFGISSEESDVFAVATGQPIVSIGAIIQHDSSALVSLKDSGLTTPKTLQGKIYAGFGAPYEEPIIDTMMKTDGDDNPSFQNVTLSIDSMEAVEQHKADFVWVFMGWDGVHAQQQGYQLNVMPITKYGVPDRYTPIIITNQDLIKNKADAIKRFMTATTEGYNYAIAHPKEAADILVEANKDSLTDKAFVEASQAYLSPLYAQGADYWGEQQLNIWSDYGNFLFKNNLLVDANNKPLSKNLDYQTLYSNQFLGK